MAGAEAAVQHVICERPQISQRLIKGSKFLKWPKSDGDDSSFVPVTLRVDPKGFILYWQEPSKDAECIEISSIRDTRRGKYAKEPKQEKFERAIQTYLDAQQYKQLHNSGIELCEICFTIVCGCRLVDMTFYNFVAVESNPREVVTEWADLLLKLAYHPTTRHMSLQTGYEKAYCKLKHDTDQMGKIPVSKVIRMLGAKSKLVENALHTIGITNSKKDNSIDPENFQFIQFRKLLQLVCPRPEIDNVFSQLGTGARRMYINHDKVKEFVNKKQRDPTINQLLYPFMNDENALEVVQKYEPNVMFANKGKLTLEGFESYLQSDDNLMVGMDAYTLDEELVYPLSHYFVNSSHNTYLTGTQLKSKSSAEMYRQVLLTGCRCVELDCWDREEEPAITHGFTFCTDVGFREVIEAINESAFKTSPFPVVLSFENHVDVPEQQAKMAKYCREIFGEKLLIDPLLEFPLTAGTPLPTPKDLMFKIIIKNKKQRQLPQHTQKERRKASQQDDEAKSSNDKRKSSHPEDALSPSSGNREQRRRSFQPEDQTPGSLLSTPGQDRKKPLAPMQENEVTPQNKSSSAQQNRRNSKDVKSPAPKTPSLPPVSTPEPTNTGSDDAKPETPSTETGFTAAPQVDKAQEPTPTSDSPPVENGDTPKTDATAATAVVDGGKPAGEKTAPAAGDAGEKPAGEKVEEMFEEEDELLEDEDEDEGELTTTDYEIHAKDSGTASKESKASAYMSQLVNYVQPVRFKSFEVSSRRNHSYEISSFTETTALKLLTDDPVGFVKYNQRQMSRIYPKGARVESSNYMPQMFWNAGSQFVALNFQVLDLPMQLNMAKFELNGSCGYLPKPLLMRSKDKIFDPFAERIDGVVAKQLNIKILSGQFLSSSKLSTYVEVDMFGLPTDTYRKRFKTKTVENNALNPQYNSPLYQFERIILPDLALLRIAVMDSSGNMIGQRFFPVEKIKPGYRYITLHNEGNQAMMMQSLFIYAEIQDYVSKDDQDMINMLVNPIQAMAEKARKEEEFRSRINAMKNLLDVEEMAQLGIDDVDDHHPATDPINSGNNDDSTNTRHNTRNGPNNIHNGVDQRRKPPSGVVANHRPGGRPNPVPNHQHQPSSKPSLDTKVDKYEPQTLTDLKLGKNYLKLMKEHDKMMKSHREKQKENFGKFYFQLYPSERPVSTIAKFFGFKPTVNSEMAELNEEVKEKKLLDFLSRQLEEDKDWQMNQIDHIITKFHQIVTNHQKWELSNLASICQKEETEVQRRKDKEKEELIHNIPVNLDKTETDKKRSEITQNHINSCVEERLILTTKQTERKKEVEEKQNEIKKDLDEESKTRMEEVEKQTEVDLRNLPHLLKKKISELRTKSTRTSTSSSEP